jgi:hypothetical protein
MLVKLLLAAAVCEVMMPLPLQFPPLRPSWTSPMTPL